MQVSMYSASSSRHSPISATDDTSTDRLTTNPPAIIGREHLAVVVRAQRELLEAHALELGQPAAGVVGRDHDHALARRAYVAQYQRQRALADGSEADDHDRSGKIDLIWNDAHLVVLAAR